MAGLIIRESELGTRPAVVKTLVHLVSHAAVASQQPAAATAATDAVRVSFFRCRRFVREEGARPFTVSRRRRRRSGASSISPPEGQTDRGTDADGRTDRARGSVAVVARGIVRVVFRTQVRPLPTGNQSHMTSTVGEGVREVSPKQTPQIPI